MRLPVYARKSFTSLQREVAFEFKVGIRPADAPIPFFVKQWISATASDFHSAPQRALVLFNSVI